MIRLFVKLGKWLEARFPEKLLVKMEDWTGLHNWIQLVERASSDQGRKLLELQQNLDTVLSRLSTVESNAVHKEAVQVLVTHVQTLKDETASLKASLGLNRIGDASIRAMLNGEPITEGTNE